MKDTCSPRLASHAERAAMSVRFASASIKSFGPSLIHLLSSSGGLLRVLFSFLRMMYVACLFVC